MNFSITTTQISGQAIETVDPREIHGVLEIESRFNDWIVNRINDGGFVENQDYVIFTKILVKPQGGRPAIEYRITQEMAKHL